MDTYSPEILDLLKIQNTYLQDSCFSIIKNMVHTHHAETSQRILEMVFRDKNITNLFPENVNKLNKYINNYTTITDYSVIKQIKLGLSETEFLPNEILIGCFQIIIPNGKDNIRYQLFTNLGRYSVIITPHTSSTCPNKINKVKLEGDPLPLTNEYISIVVNFIKTYTISHSQCGNIDNPFNFFKNILEIYKEQHPLISELKQNQHILDEINERVYLVNRKEKELNNFALKCKEDERILENEKTKYEDKKRKLNTRLKTIIDREKHIETGLKLKEFQKHLLDLSNQLIDICSITYNELIENEIEDIIKELELINCDSIEHNSKTHYNITFNI